jgi:hypothetical protein
MAPVALAAVGATAGYAFAGTAAATAMGVTMGQAMFAGASLGMMAGGQIQEAQTQAAVMRQNAMIAERDALQQQQTAAYNARIRENEAIQAQQIAAYNAQIHENEAVAAEQRARFEADKAAKDARRLRSEQTAMYGYAGVQLTGTPLVIEADSEFMDEANQSNLLALGATDAWRYRSQAQLESYQAGIEADRYMSAAAETRRQGTIAGQTLTAQADVDKYQAGTTIQAGNVKAATTILGGTYKALTIG